MDMKKSFSCWYMLSEPVPMQFNLKKLGRCLLKQHTAQWRGVGDTQRQATGFMSGPSLGTREKFITCSMIHSIVVTGLLMVIIPWGEIFTYWGCLTAACVGSAGWDRKTGSHLVWVRDFDVTQTWESVLLFFWNRRMLEI